MERYLLSAPTGFNEATVHLNSVAASHPELLRDLADQIMSGTAISLENVAQCSDAVEDWEVDESAIASVVEALRFVFHGARKLGCTPELLNGALSSSTDMSENAAATCAASWSAADEGVRTGATAAGLSVGALRSVEWKVGVAMSSSQCKELGVPFVTLKLVATDGAGLAQTARSVELSLPEFEEMHATLREAAQCLEE
jgi:hypothetical protein